MLNNRIRLNDDHERHRIRVPNFISNNVSESNVTKITRSTALKTTIAKEEVEEIFFEEIPSIMKEQQCL